jgi:glycosyltransferase involved in cell wall biosynthesis
VESASAAGTTVGEPRLRPTPVPKRVGLVAPLPPQIGGVASVAAWLLEHEDEIGCRYEAFDLWRPADGQLGGRLQLAAIPRQLRLAARFGRWLRHAPGVVHYCVACSIVSLSRDLSFVLMARASGRRVIAHVHGSEFANARSARFFQIPAMRLLARVTAERVALSPWAATELERLGISSRCIVNPVRLRGDGERTEAQAQALRLLFVGTYGKVKGCDALLDALARARESGVEATLRFVGKEMYDGEEDELRALARSRGIGDVVEFAGLQPPDRLPEFYSAADVICLPSHREVLPMALLEGMSFGLPALASTVGGIPDVVEPGRTGILVEPGDAEQLADGIRFLAADPERRLQMGRLARAGALAKTAPETITAAWRQLYGEVT